MIGFSSLKDVLRNARYGERLRPVRDWLVILACIAALTLASAVWNAWTFVRVANGDILGGAPPALPAPFSGASLQRLQNIFDARAAEEAKYTTGAYPFADPSQ